tara:strand:- start:147 stop:329 length:183 start_codon:yes stop_codon:yes gene_type:complete
MKETLKVNIHKFDKAIHDLTKCVSELTSIKDSMDKALIKAVVQMSLIRQEIMASIDEETE